jgi:hypothetical protein
VEAFFGQLLANCREIVNGYGAFADALFEFLAWLVQHFGCQKDDIQPFAEALWACREMAVRIPDGLGVALPIDGILFRFVSITFVTFEAAFVGFFREVATFNGGQCELALAVYLQPLISYWQQEPNEAFRLLQSEEFFALVRVVAAGNPEADMTNQRRLLAFVRELVENYPELGGLGRALGG